MNIRNILKKITRFTQADIRKNMRGVDLSHRDLSGLNFSGVDLTGANLSFAILTGADFTRAILIKANLCGAYFAGEDLYQPYLLGSASLFNDGSSIGKEMFAGSFGANLSHANLTRANCYNADFSNCYVDNANFSSAKLPGAKFDGALLLHSRFNDVLVNRKTDFGISRESLTLRQNVVLNDAYQHYFKTELYKVALNEAFEKMKLLLIIEDGVLPSELNHIINIMLFQMVVGRVEETVHRIPSKLAMLNSILSTNEIFGEERKSCIPVIIEMKRILKNGWLCDLQKWDSIQYLSEASCVTEQSARAGQGLFEPEFDPVVGALFRAIKEDRLEGFKRHFDTICEQALAMSDSSVPICNIQ